MELYEESFMNKQDNHKKTARLILIIIGVLLFVTIALIAVIAYINSTTLSVSLNGEKNNKIKEMIVCDQTDPSKVYIPIREIASYLGYEAFNGDYVNKSEDISKCYIQNEFEIATFSLNSQKIYKFETKTDSTEVQNTDYEYFYTSEPVKAINGVLYTTIDGIEQAFNVSFQYDVDNKRITIYTLDYLINSYTNLVLDYGYVSIDESFNNQKAMLDDMLVVHKSEEDDSQIAVIQASTGKTIIEPKYEEISYLQNAASFIVKTNGKTGIISKTRETKVEPIYDEIKLMDSDNNLYVATNEEKQGVIDINGNIIIHLEYEQIGIDASPFTQNDIKTGYILADTLIPAKKDSLWGFFDKKGNLISNFQYTDIGCVANNSQNANNLVVIPDYDVIVVSKEDKFTLITLQGKEVFPCVLDDIYMLITAGTKQYYMTYQDNQIEVLSYLDRMGLAPKGTRNNRSTTTTTENTVTQTNTTIQ